ncbi:MAG: hypothetical protein HDT42_04805 [Ruminococcaceae bacterium]|nr:hypothetical protein [Oscillospiraceae bacterium]
MKITIEGSLKEIAELAVAIQTRQSAADLHEFQDTIVRLTSDVLKASRDSTEEVQLQT